MPAKAVSKKVGHWFPLEKVTFETVTYDIIIVRSSDFEKRYNPCQQEVHANFAHWFGS